MMSERIAGLFSGTARIAILIATSILVAGCFHVPQNEIGPAPGPSQALADKVRTALAGHSEEALAYAGLYDVLADRLESHAYPNTTQAAAVARRAAEILKTPGLLKQIVDDEINPLLGTPQELTPEFAARAAARLRELSRACREAAR